MQNDLLWNRVLFIHSKNSSVETKIEDAAVEIGKFQYQHYFELINDSDLRIRLEKWREVHPIVCVGVNDILLKIFSSDTSLLEEYFFCIPEEIEGPFVIFKRIRNKNYFFCRIPSKIRFREIVGIEDGKFLLGEMFYA